MPASFQGRQLGKKDMYKRNRRIVELRDTYGLTLEALGRRFGLSATTVGVIYHKVKGSRTGG